MRFRRIGVGTRMPGTQGPSVCFLLWAHPSFTGAPSYFYMVASVFQVRNSMKERKKKKNGSWKLHWALPFTLQWPKRKSYDHV